MSASRLECTLAPAGLYQFASNFSNTVENVSGPVAIISVGAEVARTNSSGLYQVRAAWLGMQLDEGPAGSPRCPPTSHAALPALSPRPPRPLPAVALHRPARTCTHTLTTYHIHPLTHPPTSVCGPDQHQPGGGQPAASACARRWVPLAAWAGSPAEGLRCLGRALGQARPGWTPPLHGAPLLRRAAPSSPRPARTTSSFSFSSPFSSPPSTRRRLPGVHRD